MSFLTAILGKIIYRICVRVFLGKVVHVTTRSNGSTVFEGVCRGIVMPNWWQPECSVFREVPTCRAGESAAMTMNVPCEKLRWQRGPKLFLLEVD